MRLEDMRLFAKVAEAKGFSAASRTLGIPKQTLSRRISELEEELGVQLLQRTTRKLHLTDVGAAYAERCAEVARLADEANQAVTETRREPSGVLRVTADPLFGEAFVTPLVVDYAKSWPKVEVDVLLTRRKVDLLEEGFDVAFRLGAPEASGLTTTDLGPARVRYCASPSYVSKRGRPKAPADLSKHECILLHGDGPQVRWPFPGKKGMELLPVHGRLRFNSFAMQHAAVRAGLGIGLFPEFACAEDLQKKRLVSLFEPVDVGAVWLVHPARRYLSARVRTFVDLAVKRFRGRAPWVVNG